MLVGTEPLFCEEWPQVDFRGFVYADQVQSSRAARLGRYAGLRYESHLL